jgi:hypothetical protein
MTYTDLLQRLVFSYSPDHAAHYHICDLYPEASPLTQHLISHRETNVSSSEGKAHRYFKVLSCSFLIITDKSLSKHGNRAKN